MTPFKRGRIYHIDVRWKGTRRLQLSTGTTNKARAVAMNRTLYALRSAGRRDLLGLLAEGKVTLPELHEAYEKRGDELEHLKARAESPRLGDLIEKWLGWLPTAVSVRTKRRYAPRTVTRYRVSWEGFFEVLPRGRDSTLADLTPGFVADYRQVRHRATGGRRRQRAEKPLAGATMNRDLAALGSFLTWARDAEGLPVTRPSIPRERESPGKERWLSADELRGFRAECPEEWWSFFSVLFYTGARVGEVRGLRGSDILLHAKRITIHEADRRVKSAHAVRDLPIPSTLEEALAAHLARVAPGPADLVFPGDYQGSRMRTVWDHTCKAAAIAGATPHDARHTFGVHAAQAGVPLVRLQQLMGHASPHMTLRYMKHAPEAYLDTDAATIEQHMSGSTDREAAARTTAARQGLKRA